MYCYKKILIGALLFAGFAVSPVSAEQPEKGYRSTGDEVAIRVRIGGGYGGYYGRPYNRGRYYRPYYGSRGYRYGYPGYYRYNRPWRYNNYYDPGYYYYGRPYGGVYFRFGN